MADVRLNEIKIFQDEIRELSESVENKTGISLIDVNAPKNERNSIEFTRRSSGGWNLKWAMDGDIEQKGPCRVKYHRFYY